MTKIIASTYEIEKYLGAGGGGVVYLARHLRLEKYVVLKADKRKITTNEVLLRREVNVLKDLRHTNIPQVYDYFEEDGTVYTVIDYIPGESLDKPLRRGEIFPQAQVIRWARQLLNALAYLHAPVHGDPPRGYVHSDIKPANLMKTPNGDICLIDFNIALAIGEETAVGLSAGYASPEHYGLDFSSPDDTSVQSAVPEHRTKAAKSVVGKKVSGGISASADAAETEDLQADRKETVLLQIPAIEKKTGGGDPKVRDRSRPGISPKSESGSASCGKKKIVPDVRSDIYSVGATLYHLLSGVRPARDAREVIPLSGQVCSPLVAEIIAKAMNPNPDLRYQTAEEMLLAIDRLYTDDRRVKKLNRGARRCGIALAICMFIGIAAMFTGMRAIRIYETQLKLIEYSKNALDAGDAQQAADYALQALNLKGSFSGRMPAAESALTEALGIYDLDDTYEPCGVIQLSSEPVCMALSPDGKYMACICSAAVSVYDAQTAEQLAELPAQKSALADVKFTDNETILYAGADGITAYSIRTGRILWTGNTTTSIAVSADGQTAACVYRDDPCAFVYRTADGELLDRIDFGGKAQRVIANDLAADPNDNILALNSDGTKLAVSFADGSLCVFDLQDSGNDMEILGPGSGYTHFEGGFSGKYFAFAASGEDDSIFSVTDTQTGEQMGQFRSESAFGTQSDENGIYVRTENILIRLDPESGDQIPLVTTKESILSFAVQNTGTVISTEDGFSFYGKNAQLLSAYSSDVSCNFLLMSSGTALAGSMDSVNVRTLHARESEDTEILSYDTSFGHSEARISADRKTVMLFSYESVRLCDTSGEILAEWSVPDADEVYDQQYIRDEDGSRLEILYNDGHVIAYSAEDGSIVYEEDRPRPDESLQEEFETDDYLISAPLHGAPTVCDKETGKELFELEEDAFLTYVTQLDHAIVMQYMTADGYYYGLLMNENCEVTAELPYLCDVMDGALYFDYPSGNIRYTHIFNTDEILQIAEGVKNQ